MTLLSSAGCRGAPAAITLLAQPVVGAIVVGVGERELRLWHRAAIWLLAGFTSQV